MGKVGADAQLHRRARRGPGDGSPVRQRCGTRREGGGVSVRSCEGCGSRASPPRREMHPYTAAGCIPGYLRLATGCIPGHPRPAPGCIPRAAGRGCPGGRSPPPSLPSRARSLPAVPGCGSGGAGYGQLGSPIPAAVPFPEAAPAAASAARPHGDCAPRPPPRLK